MRSVFPVEVERDWHATACMAAGFSLAMMGGFVGSLLKERGALTAAQRATATVVAEAVGAGPLGHGGLPDPGALRTVSYPVGMRD